MTKVFVFAKEIRKALDEGKTEIEVPEGAQLSAAAADLVRDHQATLKYVPREPSPDSAAPPATEAAPPDEAGEETADAPREAVEVSEAELEEIVDRVIERFRALKGAGSAPSQDSEREQPSKRERPDRDDLVICRCEEITRGEIKEAIRNGLRTLNGVKRVTRAGMGLCQGQTCERLVSQLLARELGVPAGEVAPTTARAPVRPVRLSTFATG